MSDSIPYRKYMIRGYPPNDDLRAYTDDELIELLDHNDCIETWMLAGLCSEILRRMNKDNPIFPKQPEIDWGNPITP